jgi:DNA topoisomerase-1
MKKGRYGNFLACSRYPECKSTRSPDIGISCPRCGAKLAERRSKRGKIFYGCTAYPKCDFASWDKPVAETCPSCKSPYLVEKESKKEGPYVACPVKECSYRRSL